MWVIFALNGWTFSSWASRLPAVRDGLSFRPDQMGLLLLAMSAGSLVALPWSGMLVERFGVRTIVTISASTNMTGFAISALGAANGVVPAVFVGLFFAGVGMGIWDAAMNLEAATVEQQIGRTIMPHYHAAFSIGTVVGAAAGAGASWLGLSLATHMLLALAVALTLVLTATRWTLPHTPAPPQGARSRAVLAWKEPRTLLIGVVVIAAGLTEGSAGDWVALAVVDSFEVDHTIGAAVFGLFLLAMTLTRMASAKVIDRYGRARTMRTLGLVGFVGVLLFGLSGEIGFAAAGVVLWGIGAAVGFPVAMSAAADTPQLAPARIAVISTIGYTAFLTGPPLIGLIAHNVGYQHALTIVAVPVAAAVLAAGVLRPERSARPALGLG